MGHPVQGSTTIRATKEATGTQEKGYRTVMASVPYLQAGGLGSRNANGIDSHHILVDQYRSTLPPQLREIKHITSISIKRIGIESNMMQKSTSESFHMGDNHLHHLHNHHKNIKKLNEKGPNNSISINIDRETDIAQENNNAENIQPKKIRKGKSSYLLHKSYYTSEITELEKNKSPSKSKDDNFLPNQKPALNNSLMQPIEIRRQHEFQKINYETFFNCFYTINNFLNIDKPYFISRIFPYFAEVADELEIHVFAKSATINLFIKRGNDNWKLIKQYHVKLSLLINLGDNLELIEERLKGVKNILILKLSDDCYYTLPNDSIERETIDILRSTYLEKIAEKFDNFYYKQTSCSYDQIMTMNNYSRCIHDLLYTKNTLDYRISNEIKRDNGIHNIMDQSNTLKTSNEHLKEVLDRKISHNYQLQSKINSLKQKKEKLKSRNMQIKYPPTSNIKDTSIGLATETYDIQRESLKLQAEINLEKARIADIIQFIFPMKPIKFKHDFSLFQTCFPSSLIPHSKYVGESDHTKIIPTSILSSTIIQRLTQISRPHCERLNALIGYIAQIVLTVADIFNIPLRYPIRVLGSNSYINDPISNFNATANTKFTNMLNDTSITKTSTIYPLFICQNATLAVKFTYALFLLRKNLEQLYEVEGIVKVEEFNLLIACKIWLTCVEGYADAVKYGNSNDDDDDFINSVGNIRISSDNPDTVVNTSNEEQWLDNINDASKVHFNSDISDRESPEYSPRRDPDEGESTGDILSPLLRPKKKDISLRRISGSSKLSKLSNPSILSGVSRDSAISGLSVVSAASNANSIVNEYNQKLHSEERIKHIKNHLLKGTGGKL